MRQAITVIAVAAVLFTATCGGHQRNGARDTALTAANSELSTHNSKLASIIPADVRLIARDAGIALSAGGYTLSWKYANPADYNQDGIVALEDLAQLTEHFNEAATPANDWIDGSGDGVIGVADITPIAMNWGSEVTGYRIDGAEAAEGPWSEVAQVGLADADASGGRLAFMQEIAPGYTYYRVVTNTPDGDAAYSNILIAPSNEPIIYDVSPTSGYQHEGYTFSATASGQEPLTYAWDFGGGASPNTSSDISPTVTLSDAGEYSATLTISNSYGPATYPFTLSVSARDTWAHTWGGTLADTPSDLIYDESGNVYVVGRTDSFMTGNVASTFLMEYTSSGELRWVKAWEGLGVENVKFNVDGSLIGAGTTGEGQGNGDIVLASFNHLGDLQWAKTWGTPGYEWEWAMDVDEDGNIYLAGNQYVFGGYRHILVCKFNSQGDNTWARTWEGTDYDDAYDIAVFSGNIYVCGRTSSFGAGGKDALMLKYDVNGELQWAKTYGGHGDEVMRSIMVSKDFLYLSGATDSFGQGRDDCLVVKCDFEGSIVWARTWGSTHSESISSLVNNDGCITGIGSMTWFGSSVYLLTFNNEEWPVLSYRWYGEDSKGYSAALDGDGNIFMVGVAPNIIGSWNQTDGTASEITLVVGSAAGTTSMIEGVQMTFTVTENTPEGILDVGGGGDDVLVLKNFPM